MSPRPRKPPAVPPECLEEALRLCRTGTALRWSRGQIKRAVVSLVEATTGGPCDLGERELARHMRAAEKSRLTDLDRAPEAIAGEVLDVLQEIRTTAMTRETPDLYLALQATESIVRLLGLDNGKWRHDPRAEAREWVEGFVHRFLNWIETEGLDCPTRRKVERAVNVALGHHKKPREIGSNRNPE